MPDVNSILNTLTQLRTRPPAAPSPLPQLTRRAGQIRRRRNLTMILGSALLVAAGGVALARTSGDGTDSDVATGPDVVAPEGATTPTAFLDEVISLIEDHAYFATPNMVESWRAEVPEVAASATAPAETYEFVNQMVGTLNANRSGHALWHPDRAAAYEMMVPTPLEGLPPWRIDRNVGYIEMTAVDATPGTDDGRQYIEHVRSALSAPACGWILDLRASYPHPSTTETMLSAITPLLPTGAALGYRFNDGRETMLLVGSDGSISSTPDDTLVAPAVGAGTPRGVPVAILQGPGTASAYESVLLALHGREGVRTFGEPSAGQAFEVMDSYPLSDGSLLWLTTGITVDHAGRIVDGQIQPDVAASAERTEAGDPARTAAAAWLAEQGSCQ